jgi:cell division transport system ATP-binding protein
MGASEDSIPQEDHRNPQINRHIQQEGQVPLQLSGGEQQRTAIARRAGEGAADTLADEPTGNLDWEVSQYIMDLMKDIHAQGTTIVFATHDMELIKTLPKRVIEIEAGRVKE